MRRVSEALGVAAVYVGAVVGAGFASGREIVNFFTVYGAASHWAVVLAALLFTVVGYATVSSCRGLGANSYQELYQGLSSYQAGRLFAQAVTLFLYLGLTIMVSGSATLISQLWRLPLWLSSLLTVLLLTAVLFGGPKGIQQASGLLVLIMVVFIIYLFVSIAPGHSPVVTDRTSYGLAFFSALLYVSFNSIVISVVITSLLRTVSGGALAAGIVLGALLLGMLLYCCNGLLLNQMPQVQEQDMPLLQVVIYCAPALEGVYLINLWAAFITTALANVMGLLQRIQANSRHSLKAAGMLLSTVPLASVGFSRLVAAVYPVLGYLALPFIVATVWQFLRH